MFGKDNLEWSPKVKNNHRYSFLPKTRRRGTSNLNQNNSLQALGSNLTRFARLYGTFIVLFGFAGSLLAEPALLWTKEFGKRSIELIDGATRIPGEGYFMYGFSNDRQELNETEVNLCVMFADEDLQQQWRRTIYLGSSNYYCNYIGGFIDQDNAFNLLADVLGAPFGSGLWLFRYNLEGDSLPARRLSDELQAQAWLMLPSSDIIVIANDSDYNLQLTRITIEGDTLQSINLGLLVDEGDVRMTSSPDGTLWMIYETFDYIDFESTIEIIKISPEGEIVDWTEMVNDWHISAPPIPTDDGGLLVLTSNGFTKFDGEFNVIWSTSFHYAITGGLVKLPENETEAIFRMQDEQGDVYLAAVRLNSSGEIVSRINYPEDMLIFQVSPDSDDQAFAIGAIDKWGAYWEGDFWLARFDFDGNMLDSAKFGIPGQDEENVEALTVTASGDYLLALYTGNYVEDVGGMQVMKVSANGDSVTTREYESGAADSPENLINTSDGGSLLIGVSYYFDFPLFRMTSIPARFIRLDENLDTLWTLDYAPQEINRFQGAVETSDGGFLVAGSTSNMDEDSTGGELLKISPDGQIVDIQRWENYSVAGIREAHAGEYIMGWTYKSPDDNYRRPGFMVVDEDLNVLLTNRDSLNIAGAWIYDYLCDPDLGYILVGSSDWKPTYFLFDRDGNLVNSYVHARHGQRAFIKILPYTDHLNLAVDNVGSLYLLRENGTQSYFYDYREHNDWYDVTAQFVDVQFYPATPPYQTATFLGSSYGGGVYNFSSTSDIYMTKAEMIPLDVWEEGFTLVPTTVELSPVYPNPFNAIANISYSLPKSSEIKLAVFDALGRQVTLLDEGSKSAGEHQLVVDASGWPTGIYISRLEAGGVVRNSKMIVVR